MTRSELAWELAELFTDLRVDEINEMLAKNVPLDTLRILSLVWWRLRTRRGHLGCGARSLPNLLVLGYILRVLEERLLDSEETPSGH